MKDVIIYLLTSALYFSAFYLFFLVLLNNDTHYTRNRYFLLFSLFISLILPLVSISIDPGSTISPFLTGIGQVVPVGEITVFPLNNFSSGLKPLSILAIVYFTGVFISLLFLSINLFKLRIMIRNGAVNDSRIINTHKNGISGFSAFGYIFIDNHLSAVDKTRITEHERIHLELKHFPDILITKLYSAFFWFNPMVYLFERSLKALHEFQVDSKMIDQGEDLLGYQRLILNQLFRTNIFSVQSAFSGKTLIKKRMIMMTKKKSKKLAGLKLLLIIPVALPLFAIFSCSVHKKDAGTANPITEAETVEKSVAPAMVYVNPPSQPVPAPKEVTKPEPQKETILYSQQEITMDPKKPEPEEGQVFIVVEDMPTFEGGNVDNFRKWVMMNVKYPEEAVLDSITGKVYVIFVVNREGKVTRAEILRGVHPLLDAEALRVVNLSPLWVPGKQRGELVDVRFSITVNFAIN